MHQYTTGGWGGSGQERDWSYVGTWNINQICHEIYATIALMKSRTLISAALSLIGDGLNGDMDDQKSEIWQTCQCLGKMLEYACAYPTSSPFDGHYHEVYVADCPFLSNNIKITRLRIYQGQSEDTAYPS